MENRFSVKDLFLFVLLLVLVIVVVLAMFQYDRQWETLRSIDRQVAEQRAQSAEQTRILSDIRSQLQRGIPTLANTNPTTNTVGVTPTTQQSSFASEKGDPFQRQSAAMRKPDYAQGDWLIQNLGTKLSKITPLLSTDVYASMIQARVQETLMYRDPYTLEYLPMLATSWKVKDNSEIWKQAVEKLKAAGKTEDDIAKDESLPVPVEIVFQLRGGVQYSDGHPFSAGDVVWSYNWICNEAVDAPRDRAYVKENIRSVDKTGENEVTFRFRKPYFESLSLAGSMTILPEHFYGRYEPKKFNESVGLLLGTGPYRLKDPESWRPGTTMELVRNERYWGLPGPFDRMLYYEVENDAAELTMFRNGEMDIFGATPEQYLSLKEDKAIVERANRYEYLSLNSGYSYIGWNQQRGGKPTRFADKRVRQAMTLLVDRERLATDIFRGYATPALGPFSPSNKQNAPEVKAWPCDPKRALALLKDAGYEDRNGDGVLESPAGEPFKFSFIYGSKSPTTEQIALFLKDSFAKVGIIVAIEPTDWPIMLKKLETRDFDSISLGWSGGAETDLFQIFHSSQIQGTGDDVISYSNPELDKLIEAARSTVDADKRMPIWQQCHRILHEDQPYTFLLNRQSLVFIDKRIQNVERCRSGLNFVNLESMPIVWYIPKAIQKHVE